MIKANYFYAKEKKYNWQFPQGGIDDGETPIEAAKERTI